MHRHDSRTDLGVIKIHANVISSIASIAASEIEGVKKVGGTSKGIVELLRCKAGQCGIRVGIDKHDEVHIAIPLVIKFGFNIPEVANRVQENVRQALEKMTSVPIKDIDINVQGIEKEGAA
jgi:uncharacterized alkaline shock family protein YloU